MSQKKKKKGWIEDELAPLNSHQGFVGKRGFSAHSIIVLSGWGI